MLSSSPPKVGTYAVSCPPHQPLLPVAVAEFLATTLPDASPQQRQCVFDDAVNTEGGFEAVASFKRFQDAVDSGVVMGAPYPTPMLRSNLPKLVHSRFSITQLSLATSNMATCLRGTSILAGVGKGTLHYTRLGATGHCRQNPGSRQRMGGVPGANNSHPRGSKSRITILPLASTVR